MYTQALIRIIPSIIIIMLTGYMLPWWSFSIITLIVGYSTCYEKESILYGFIIGFLSWFGLTKDIRKVSEYNILLARIEGIKKSHLVEGILSY